MPCPNELSINHCHEGRPAYLLVLRIGIRVTAELDQADVPVRRLLPFRCIQNEVTLGSYVNPRPFVEMAPFFGTVLLTTPASEGATSYILEPNLAVVQHKSVQVHHVDIVPLSVPLDLEHVEITGAALRNNVCVLSPVANAARIVEGERPSRTRCRVEAIFPAARFPQCYQVLAITQLHGCNVRCTGVADPLTTIDMLIVAVNRWITIDA